jgi:hypothetical protein
VRQRLHQLLTQELQQTGDPENAADAASLADAALQETFDVVCGVARNVTRCSEA